VRCGSPDAIHAPFGHHDHAIGVIHDDFHVVLHEEERDALLATQTLDVLHQPRSERRG